MSAFRSLLLWSLVALQVLVPSLYYWREQSVDDERFAWRMFSALRFRRCRVEAQEEDRAGAHALDLAVVLHASWIGLLQRGRRDVIERLLESRCREPERTGATLLRACLELDGTRVPLERYQYTCATGLFSVTQGAR